MKFFALSIMLTIIVFTTIGCDKAVKNPAESNAENELLKLSFQEENTYLGNPNHLGLSANKMNNQAPLLLDYEVTSQKMVIDDNGYVSLDKKYIEGNPDQQLPNDLYAIYKNQLPFQGSEVETVIRTVLTGNQMSYYDKSGKEVLKETVNPEDYRIDPNLLKQWKEQSGVVVNKVDRVSKVHKIWKEQGANFKQIDDRHFYVEVKIQKTGELTKQVIDAYYNLPVYVQNIDKVGAVTSEEQISYEEVDNFPLVKGRSVIHYNGDVGKNEVTSKTQMVRSNIKLTIN